MKRGVIGGFISHGYTVILHATIFTKVVNLTVLDSKSENFV